MLHFKTFLQMFSAQSVMRIERHEIYLNSPTRNRKLTEGTGFLHWQETYHLRAGLTAASLIEPQLSFRTKILTLQKKCVKMNLWVHLRQLNVEQSEGIYSHIPKSHAQHFQRWDEFPVMRKCARCILLLRTQSSGSAVILCNCAFQIFHVFIKLLRMISLSPLSYQPKNITSKT